MNTATFQDYKLQPAKRAGARGKFVLVDVIDTLHPVTISFGGVTKTLFVRGAEYNEPKHYSVRLYNEDGSDAMGIWQHGRYGTTPHTEQLFYYVKERKLDTCNAYASGQIKDQMRYLKAIL